MARGFKTGGRQKGARNRVTAEAIEVAKATGITPLEYMLQILRDEGLDRATRIDAAKAAAPYLHAKLIPSEHTMIDVTGRADNAEESGIKVTFVRPLPQPDE